MKSPTSELIVRAAALYLPITIAMALVIHRHPDRRHIAGAVVAVAWNLVALLVLNVLAQHFGWWTFSANTAAVAGTPADLWIGWALLWGAVPLLIISERLLLVGLALFAADLVMMPLATPVVSLRSTWLLGELLCVATCLVPGLLLGRWTARDSHVRRRATLQIVAFGGLLLYVLPTLIFTLTGEDWTALIQRPRWQFLLAAFIAAPAGAMAVQAVREFAVSGNGTPVPLDPPRRLVITGPYAYVANPMQLGGTFILAEWGVLVGSLAVVAAAVMGALFSAGVAAWNEGDELSHRFGHDWTRYRAEVRLWLPSWRPYTDTTATVFVGTTCEPCSDVGRFLARRRPQGLEIAAAEESSDEVTRITYRTDGVGTETGLAAVGRSVEHVNLAWAIGSWIVRLPLIQPLLQLVADAVGAGPRRLSREPATRSDDRPNDLRLLVDQANGVVVLVEHVDEIRGAITSEGDPPGRAEMMLEDVLQLLPCQSDCEAEHRHGVRRLSDEVGQRLPIDFREGGERAGHRPNLLALRSRHRGSKGLLSCERELG